MLLQLVLPTALAASPEDQQIRVDSSVHWRDLTIDAGRCTLVHMHSGSARAGRLTGVLGPSGSGKTSLLSALAGVLPVSVSGALVKIISL